MSEQGRACRRWGYAGAIVFFATSNNLGRLLQSIWISWGCHTLGTIPFEMLFAARCWIGRIPALSSRS